MNDIVDYPSLFEMNVREIRTYLQDSWPISEERLLARGLYEELLKNLNRRAKAAGCESDMVAPDFPALLNAFIKQNVDAEAHQREAERVRAYERGRTDMQAAIQFGAVPTSFQFFAPASPQPTRNLLTDRTSGTSVSSGHYASNSPTTNAPYFSVALGEYLEADALAGKSADGRRNVELIVQFLIDELGDIRVNALTEEQIRQFDLMLPDIPDRTNIPREHCASLSTRYRYALQHGWDNLKRLTEARIRDGYHNALSKFFGWLIEQEYRQGPKPVFNEISGKNLVSLPRDSFEYEEIKKIFSQPLFVGCASPQRIWRPGTYFVQNHLYWGYILLLLHGLRISEVGKIDIDNVVERNGIYYIDLRPFDPQKGRVAIEDLKTFKTSASERLIPLHPLVIDLGLLERAKELKARGCEVLFPEWEPYPKPNGEMRWGQPITKSWQYLKNQIGIQRADVTAYSTRHWFAQFLDSTDISHRGRKLVMGHSTKNDISAGYGSKTRLTTRDLQQIITTPSPEVQFMTETLLRAKSDADAGRLVIVKPWLQKAKWSEYYRSKHS